MSRANTEASRLRRIKRIASRHGLTILTAQKPSSKTPEGGYMLSLDAARKVVLGDKPVPYSANLEQVEAYIDALEEGGDEAEP